MNNSSDNSDNGRNDNLQIDYYKLTFVEKDQLLSQIQQATAALNKQRFKDSKNACEFVQ